MKSQIYIAVSCLLAASTARPIVSDSQGGVYKREVPQEHSHESVLRSVTKSLVKNNPDKIADSVFGLLGDEAAAEGKGNINDEACLQQATADQAFTNAKADNDVDGMTAALIYRALERNTGSVGLVSEQCTSIQAKNPEIAAIQQHQDPASKGAAQVNKDIALTLAQQIDSIGGEAKQALRSGTFAPGETGDPTAAGNTCNEADDPIGCIFTQKLLVKDASVAEINAAVANGGAGNSASGNASAIGGANSCNGAGAGTGAGAGAGAGGNAGTPQKGASAAPELDLGSCTDPTIAFELGFDGRQEKSFQPSDTEEFTHGSALNIGVITDFICQQLDTKCEASEAALKACEQGAADAETEEGQAAADAFNAALVF